MITNITKFLFIFIIIILLFTDINTVILNIKKNYKRIKALYLKKN